MIPLILLSVYNSNKIRIDSYMIPIICVILFLTFGIEQNADCHISDIFVDSKQSTTFVAINNVFGKCNGMIDIINLLLVLVCGMLAFLLAALICIEHYLGTYSQIKNYINKVVVCQEKQQKYFEKNNIKNIIQLFFRSNIVFNYDEISDGEIDGCVYKKLPNKFRQAIMLNINYSKRKCITAKLTANGNIHILGCETHDEIICAIDKIINFASELNIRTPQDLILQHDKKFIVTVFDLPYFISFSDLKWCINNNREYISDKYGVNIYCDNENDNTSPYVKFSMTGICPCKIILFRNKATISCMVNGNNYSNIIEIHKKFSLFFREYEKEIKTSEIDISSEKIEREIYNFCDN